MQKRFGPFGEPVTVGFVMGLVIGMLAGYDTKSVLQLAVKTAAVMLLMPRVIKPIMDGLTPIAKHARKRLQAKFGGQEFLIGLDPALLLGHTSVVSASLIFIPLTILIAVLVPGNQCCLSATLRLSASSWQWRSRFIRVICSVLSSPASS